jgi:hypothetical protein
MWDAQNEAKCHVMGRETCWFLVTLLKHSLDIRAAKFPSPPRALELFLTLYVFHYYFIFFSWSETESTWYCGHCLASCTSLRWWWWLWSNRRNEDWHGKPKSSEKTCPSTTLPTTNPTWPDPSSNPGRRGGKPATNRLSYGTAHYYFMFN